MPTRRLVPVLAAAALALAGCGDASDTTTTSGTLADVTVTGAAPASSVKDAAKAQAPTVTAKKTPIVATKVESKVLSEGKGAVVKKDDIVTVHALIVDGADGKKATATYGQSAVPIALTDGKTFPALLQTLPGKKVGSRVLLISPPASAWGADGNSQLGITGKDSVVFVLDVLSTSTPLKEATGKAIAPKKGLPTVRIKAAGEQATITTPKGVKAPKKLVVQPLVQGAGTTVEKGATVRVAYTGAIWGTNKVFDSSAKTPEKFFETQIGVGQVVPGWDKGLVGQKVGSRVLLVVPPNEGYGPKGNQGIKGTDTMIFSVDILAAS